MKPRDRVITALNHIRPDRTPCDFWARPEVWRLMKEHYRAGTDEMLLQRLGVDLRTVTIEERWAEYEKRATGRLPGETHLSGKKCVLLDERTLQDPWGTVWRAGENFKYVQWVKGPLQDTEDLTAVAWPDFGIYEPVEDIAKKVAEYKDDYFVYGAVDNPFKRAWSLRGLENFLMDSQVNQGFAVTLMNRCAEYELEKAKRLAQAGADMVGINGDIAMQDRLLMNPKVWRETQKPIFKYMAEQIRAVKPDVRLFYHSDGNIMDVIPDFIEIGFQVINPIQPECMDPAEVKRRFGDKITMHGTVSLQRTLPRGTPEQVREETRHTIETCGYNGGLILCPSNLLQFDTPVPNIVALYETIREESRLH